jgi:hypothetical protein
MPIIKKGKGGIGRAVFAYLAMHRMLARIQIESFPPRQPFSTTPLFSNFNEKKKDFNRT